MGPVEMKEQMGFSEKRVEHRRNLSVLFLILCL